MNEPIFDQDVVDFAAEHGEDIRSFVNSSVKPDTFMSAVVARLVTVTLLQSPVMLAMAKLGFNIDQITDLITVGTLLGIYAERQGWTLDNRDLDLSAFEDK